MNKEEFIDAIKLVVSKGSIEAMKSKLLKPPGRQPSRETIESSDWFNKLKPEDKNMVMKIVSQSVEMSVFGFLCVLDGVRTIEDDTEKGDLILRYEKHGKITWLNNPNDGDYLHDLF